MKIIYAVRNYDEHGMVIMQFDAVLSDGRNISGSYGYESNSLMAAEDIYYSFDDSPKDTHHIAIMDSYPWWEEELPTTEKEILDGIRNWIDTRF